MKGPAEPPRYHLGSDFPSEGFVQAAIEARFATCRREAVPHVDFVGIDPSNGERWWIEAKGETSDTGLDFRTGLGQLLCGMAREGTRYAIAIPDTPKFAALRDRVAPWVRVNLGLHWLLVDSAGAVTIDTPPDSRWAP